MIVRYINVHLLLLLLLTEVFWQNNLRTGPRNLAKFAAENCAP